jgi:hypothetical protein
MVLSKSVNITPLTPVVGSFCIAPMKASCSALNINDWSLILLRVDADRLRPRILLFLPSVTRRCRSLCGCCNFCSPVLGIRRVGFPASVEKLRLSTFENNGKLRWNLKNLASRIPVFFKGLQLFSGLFHQALYIFWTIIVSDRP